MSGTCTPEALLAMEPRAVLSHLSYPHECTSVHPGQIHSFNEHWVMANKEGEIIFLSLKVKGKMYLGPASKDGDGRVSPRTLDARSSTTKCGIFSDEKEQTRNLVFASSPALFVFSLLAGDQCPADWERRGEQSSVQGHQWSFWALW